jgi:hypothetical protein
MVFQFVLILLSSSPYEQSFVFVSVLRIDIFISVVLRLVINYIVESFIYAYSTILWMRIENDVEFKRLCYEIRSIGVLKTNEEIMKIMINLTRRYFRENFG